MRAYLPSMCFAMITILYTLCLLFEGKSVVEERTLISDLNKLSKAIRLQEIIFDPKQFGEFFSNHILARVSANCSEGIDPLPHLEILAIQSSSFFLRQVSRQGMVKVVRLRLFVIASLSVLLRLLWQPAIWPVSLLDMLACISQLGLFLFSYNLFEKKLYEDWFSLPVSLQPWLDALFSRKAGEAYGFLREFDVLEMETGVSYEASKVSLIRLKADEMSEENVQKIQGIRDSLGAFDLVIGMLSFLTLNAVPLWYRLAHLSLDI